MRQTSHEATAPNMNRSVNSAGSCPPWASANSVARHATGNQGAGDRPGEPRGDRLAEIAAETHLLGCRLQRRREQDHNQQTDQPRGRRRVDVAEAGRRDREARREEHGDDGQGEQEEPPSTDHRSRPTTDASQPTGARCAAHTASIAAGIMRREDEVVGQQTERVVGVERRVVTGVGGVSADGLDRQGEQDDRDGRDDDRHDAEQDPEDRTPPPVLRRAQELRIAVAPGAG